MTEVAPLLVVPFSVLRDLVPINMRQYAYTLAGGQSPLTEQDFSKDDLDTLKDAVERKIKQTGKMSGVIGYGDYAKDGTIAAENTGTLDTVSKSFSDPAFRLESTLGMARYTVNKKGEIEIHDAYDFNADKSLVDKSIREKGRVGTVIAGAKHSGLWGALNAAGNMARPDGTGVPFTLNLGKHTYGH
jgi:hypothetical protein